MDWEEELKRQAAISALLAPPEQPDPIFDTESRQYVGTGDTDTLAAEIVKSKSKADYRKAVDQAFDTESKQYVGTDKPKFEPITAESVVARPEEQKTYPTIAQDQQTAPPFEPMTAESVIPYSEREKPLPPESLYRTLDTGKGVAPEAYPIIAQDQGGPEQPADALTQVERAELVKLPVEPAPDTLTQVERAQLVRLPTKAPVVTTQVEPITPQEPTRTPTQVARVEPVPKAPGAHTELAPPGRMDLREDVAQAPVTPPAQPAPPVQPPVSNQPMSLDDLGKYFDQSKPSTQTQDGASLVQVRSRIAQELADNSDLRRKLSASIEAEVGDQGPEARLAYVESVMNRAIARGQTLDQIISDPNYYPRITISKLGAQASPSPYIDQALSGSNIANFATGNESGNVRSGGAKVTYNPQTGERFVLENPDVGWEKGLAKPVDTEPPINTLVKIDQSGLNLTHFGYQGDPDLDPDSGAGHGKYVQNMIPGYDVALNEAARAKVGNPNPGETFQFAGREWRYGDKVPERYTDARFDIYDRDGIALAGGIPVGRSIAAQAQAPGKTWVDELPGNWKTLSPEEQAAAEKQAITRQQGILTDLQTKATNMPAFMSALEKPIPGVNEDVRNAVREEYKKQITAYAQDYFKEPDPQKAFARIMAAPNAGTFLGEIGTKVLPNLAHAWLSMAQQADSPIQTRLIEFINTVQPDATPEARAALVRQVMAKTGRDRQDFVNALYDHAQAENPESVKNVNMLALQDSLDIAARPDMAAREAENHARVLAAVAQNLKDLREDPTMQGTNGGTIANAIAQMPKGIAEAVVPIIGQSAMFSEIYTDTLEGLRRDHPDWSEDTLKAKAGIASLPQDILQELVNLGTLGLGGGAVRGIANPVARIATSAILHGTVTAGAGASQQVLANIVTGRPTGEGVPQAGLAAGVQGLLGGAIAGRHGAPVEPVVHPAETRPLMPQGEEVGPHGPPDVTLAVAPHGPPDVTLATGEHGPALPLRPLTREGVLGPEETKVAPGEEWYQPGPIITRGVERAAFSPEELQRAVARLSDAGMSPEQIRAVIDNLAPGFEQGRQQVLLGPEAQSLEAERTRQIQANRPPIPVKLPQGQPWLETRPGPRMAVSPHEIDLPSAVFKARIDAARARAEAALGGTPPVAPTTPVAPVPNVSLRESLRQAGQSEPWVSKIANRFMAERIAKGEIGHVEPGVGETTEALVGRGAMMGPEQVAQHVSNLMHDAGGNPVDQAAAVRYEEARLSHRSHELSLIAERNPNDQQAQIDAADAFKYVTDFHNNTVAKLKNNWHKMGMTLQGDVPVDLASFNGQREAFLKRTGKTPTPATEVALRKSAKKVRDTSLAQDVAMRRLGEAYANDRRPLPAHEQNREAIARRMKGEFPCPTT